MADGRAKNGGARPGAGRKRKVDELELHGLLGDAWPQDKRLAALKRVATMADSDRGDALDAIKLLLAYAYGKPIDRQEHSGAISIVKGYADVGPDDWDEPTTED